jgi:hypothetical protein
MTSESENGKSADFDKYDIILNAITAVGIFAAVTFFGFIVSLIILGKDYLCSLDFRIIDVMFDCSGFYEGLRGGFLYIKAMAFLGKLFVIVTLPFICIVFALLIGFVVVTHAFDKLRGTS